MASISLSLLGPLRISIDEEPLASFRSNRIPALLVYLAVEADRPHSREALAELLWPGLPLESARQNLRQTLYLLRKRIPEVADNGDGSAVPLLITDRQTAQLHPDADIALDVNQFEQLVTDHPTDDLPTAVALYRGDFLADFYLPDSESFEGWAAARRAAYRRLALLALDTLTDETLARGAWDEAEHFARRQLAIDNLRESGHRQLMQALAKSGRRRAALSHYEALDQLLASELQIEPSPETQDLAQKIRNGELRSRREKRQEEAEDGPVADNVPQRQPAKPPHNLPAESTPFVGRGAEIAQLESYLSDPESRLVTIVGLGGSGKTRLALACAERLVAAPPEQAASFGDGVFFVDLAPLGDAGQLLPALAGAINFTFQGEKERSPRQQLLDHLRPRKMVLILDDVEHLPAPAVAGRPMADSVEVLVAAILENAPHVHILTTSRQRLHLRAEQLFPLAGLAFPPGDSSAPAVVDEVALAFPAAQLFLQTARRTDAHFDLSSAEDAAALTQICRLVAGMPLALQLAAAWVESLPLPAIARELKQSLDLLESNWHDVPERQRSISAVIDNAHATLTDEERALFNALSVFRGGFTRAAIREVTGADPRLLTRLMTRQLLHYDRTTDRYAIHELLRQYGAARLAADAERETAVRDAHSRFFCSAVVRWKAELDGVSQQTAVAAIGADYRNILAGWDYALDTGQLDRLLTAVNGLGEWYDRSERWFDGMDTFKVSAVRLRALYGDIPSAAAAAELLVWLGAWQSRLHANTPYWYYQVGLPPDLQPLLASWALLAQPALADADTRAARAFVQSLLGRANHYSRPAEAGHHLEASLALYRSLGDDAGVADVLCHQAMIAQANLDRKQANDLLQAYVTRFRHLGAPRRIMKMLLLMADRARQADAFEEADDLYQEAFDYAQQADFPGGMIEARRWAAFQAWYLGHFDRARGYQEEALRLARQDDDKINEASLLGERALTHVFRGDHSAAMRSFQAGLKVEPRLEKGWLLCFAQLHAGQYARARTIFMKADEAQSHDRLFAWAATSAEDGHAEAVVLARHVLSQDTGDDFENRAWWQVPLSYSLYQAGEVEEARSEILRCLDTCVSRRAFLPMMQLMPILALVLAGGGDDRSKERAVELYALAESLPFVGNSKLYADITGQPLAAVAHTLPAKTVTAARARGRALDWWDTAATLLDELTAAGWRGPPGNGQRPPQQSDVHLL